MRWRWENRARMVGRGSSNLTDSNTMQCLRAEKGRRIPISSARLILRAFTHAIWWRLIRSFYDRNRKWNETVNGKGREIDWERQTKYTVFTIHSSFALLAPAIEFFLLLAAAKLYFIGDAHWFGRIDFTFYLVRVYMCCRRPNFTYCDLCVSDIRVYCINIIKTRSLLPRLTRYSMWMCGFMCGNLCKSKRNGYLY